MSKKATLCKQSHMIYHTWYVVGMWYLCDVLSSIEICITTVILIYALLHVHTLWLSLLLCNGRFTRPLLFLYSYLQFKSLNLMIFGFNRFVNSTWDVSYPAFLSIFAAPLISAFIHVPSDDWYIPRFILFPEKRYLMFIPSSYTGITSLSKKLALLVYDSSLLITVTPYSILTPLFFQSKYTDFLITD